MQVPTATLTGIFWPMSTGLRKILLEFPSSPWERKKGRRDGKGEKKRRERERKRKGGERKEAENGRPANGWGVMSHRPVILKLPFNIPAASVVTRKEVRGHTE